MQEKSMAEQEVVAAKPREGKFNKNAARRVRVAGMIPGVLYGAKEPAIAVEVDPKQITRILHSDSGHNTIFDLEVGAARTKAMIVDWQYEPIKGKLMHIDLKRIAMDKAMRVKVPILLEGIPVGVKMQGGILDQVLREVEIECLPGDIPSHIDLNVSDRSSRGGDQGRSCTGGRCGGRCGSGGTRSGQEGQDGRSGGGPRKGRQEVTF
jgi:large subunit ribosomal protein L25